MAHEKDIVFIKRTLEALRQYDQYKADLQQSYARTLFINSCIGLLIIPQSSQLLNNLSNEIITKEKWGIDPRDIEVLNTIVRFALSNPSKKLLSTTLIYETKKK